MTGPWNPQYAGPQQTQMTPYPNQPQYPTPSAYGTQGPGYQSVSPIQGYPTPPPHSPQPPCHRPVQQQYAAPQRSYDYQGYQPAQTPQSGYGHVCFLQLGLITIAVVLSVCANASTSFSPASPASPANTTLPRANMAALTRRRQLGPS